MRLNRRVVDEGRGVDVAGLVIRPAREADVGALLQAWPGSVSQVDRLRRQAAGASIFVLGWLDGAVVARAELKLAGCAAEPVQACHPGVPEINGLDVVDRLQGRGIGTAVIRHLAGLAVDRGFDWIGLGVEPTNDGARRLYERLGFVGDLGYEDRYVVRSRTGAELAFADSCVFLTTTCAHLLR